MTTLDKQTLASRKRAIKQGPAVIDLTFEGGKATGTVAMGGDPKPVSVDLGGELFADARAATRPSACCRSPRATRRPSATSTSASRRSS